MKKIIGIDIGSSAVKLALVSGGKMKCTHFAPVESGLIRGGRAESPEELGQALRNILRDAKLRGRHTALVLPPDAAFVRRLTMPYMTEAQLKLNLPYELQDYIQNTKEQYFYDYAVLGVIPNEDGTPAELDLLAAATPRQVIEQYRAAFKAAGLKLTLAIPQTLTYRNIIRAYRQTHPQSPEEYCIADLGHSAIRVHMYRGDCYETSRVIEFGGDLLTDTDETARREVFSRIALEIMRAVNFYGFNSPESNLQDIYFCGGLSQAEGLMDELKESLSLNCHSIEELLPSGEAGSTESQYGAAIGATLQSNGR